MEIKDRRFLYVGGFVLPDKNAAAQRVVANAMALKTIGHKVYFINYSRDIETPRITYYFDFCCYEYPVVPMYKKLFSIADIVKIIVEEQITDVIAYNYPAPGLNKLLRYCKKHKMHIYADVTEWYIAQGNIVFKTVKTIDTEWRMRKLHFKTDGVIAISEYLYNYYKNRVKTIKLPPLVDLKASKWEINKKYDERRVRFTYAGSPSAQKERLDIVIDAIEGISQDFNVILRVVGITREQYEKMYKRVYIGKRTEFLGQASHIKAIQEVKAADWSIIIREDNKVVKAGFPTKVVESISCGTPVIANDFSNILDYLNDKNSIICKVDDLQSAIIKASKGRKCICENPFNYRNFLQTIEEFFRANRQKIL